MAEPISLVPNNGEVPLPDPDMVHDYLQFIKRVQHPEDCLMIESLFDSLLFPDYDQAETPTETLHEALLRREMNRRGGFAQENDVWSVTSAKMATLKPVLKGVVIGSTIASDRLPEITHHVTHAGMKLESGHFKARIRPDLWECFAGMRDHQDQHIAERSKIVYQALPGNSFVKALSRVLGR